MYVFVVANYNCFNILISASQLVLVENNIFGAFFLQRDAQINVTFSQRSCILFTLFFQKKNVLFSYVQWWKFWNRFLSIWSNYSFYLFWCDKLTHHRRKKRSQKYIWPIGDSVMGSMYCIIFYKQLVFPFNFLEDHPEVQ